MCYESIGMLSEIEIKDFWMSAYVCKIQSHNSGYFFFFQDKKTQRLFVS